SDPSHELFGANWRRFTKTWSPTSSVFSIELDGIANAWTTKVMMNKPVTNTPADEERNSTRVSFGFSFATFCVFLSLFVMGRSRGLEKLYCQRTSVGATPVPQRLSGWS